MSDKKNSIDELFLYDIDIANRRIYLGTTESEIDSTDIGSGTIQRVIRGIDKLLAISNKEIELVVNSFGGSSYDALALVDKILYCQAKIVFIGTGAIMSAATLIMCVSDERLLTENATIMLHDGSDGFEGGTTDIQISAEEGKRLQRVFEKIYAENSYLDENFYSTICRRDLYLTAEEAIKLGLADGIIEPKKRGSFRQGIRKQTFENPPRKSEITKFVDKLYKRIKLDSPKNLVIDIKKDQIEEIVQYDHTVTELEENKNNS